jgi:hypothetical protein
MKILREEGTKPPLIIMIKPGAIFRWGSSYYIKTYDCNRNGSECMAVDLNSGAFLIKDDKAYAYEVFDATLTVTPV